MKEVELLTSAWFGDHPLVLSFPSLWDVIVIGEQVILPLTDEMIKREFATPLGSDCLHVLAAKKHRAAIVLDDLTRPTPTACLLPFIMDELQRGGIGADAVTIVVAGGAHQPASHDDVLKKVGNDLLPRVKVIAHDSRADLVDIGRSTRGTPLLVNRALMACDLKIGVGCIFPHPAAGFSGGSKIIMPAACGAETIRCMHDYVRGAEGRDGSLDTDMRQEIEEVAGRVGLDFIVNAVLNQRREIAGIFVGDRVLAHRKGVQFAAHHFAVDPVDDADIVVADMYPFDLDLQFAFDRGFWPLLVTKRHVDKVVIAACTRGLGTHPLFPIANPLWSRLTRRLSHLSLRDFNAPLTKVRTIMSVIGQKKMPIMMLSKGVRTEELRTVFPQARIYNEWREIMKELELRHRGKNVKVAVYRSAPLYLPTHG